MALPSFAYTTGVSDLTVGDLQRFFADWPLPLSPSRHFEVLRGSDHVVLAREGEEGRVVGFVTSITDGVLSAFIPLLEMCRSIAARESARSSSGGCSTSWSGIRWSTSSVTPSSSRSTAASR